MYVCIYPRKQLHNIMNYIDYNVLMLSYRIRVNYVFMYHQSIVTDYKTIFVGTHLGVSFFALRKCVQS